MKQNLSRQKPKEVIVTLRVVHARDSEKKKDVETEKEKEKSDRRCKAKQVRESFMINKGS